ncbi:MAG: LysE family transporter [Bacillota bacterium]
MRGKMFWSAFLLALSGAAAPGPLLSTTLAESLKIGWIAGPLLMTGHSALEIILIVLISRGFARFLTRSSVQSALSMAGGLVLAWMGFLLLTGIPHLGAGSAAGSSSLTGLLSLVGAGALISLANPYWSLWWATAGITQMADGAVEGKGGVAAFSGGHLLADWLWYCLVSAGMAAGRPFVSGLVYQILLGAVGMGMLIFAGYFFWKGLARWTAFFAAKRGRKPPGGGGIKLEKDT